MSNQENSLNSDKACFIICPIGKEGSETRKRSDQVLKYIITPIIEQYHYIPIRADQISDPGLITHQIIQYITDAPLVIADLTDHNPNVYYELAIRHAVQKPFIQIIKKGQEIPFDLKDMRTIYIDEHDLDSVHQAKNELENQILSIEDQSFKVNSPITFAIDLQKLGQSENTEERALASVLSELSDLNSNMSLLAKHIRHLQFDVHEVRKFNHRPVSSLGKALSRNIIGKTIMEQEDDEDFHPPS